MHQLVIALAAATAVAAATYSTWSPCGQSMLSQINPVAERSRGHRFSVTAGWYLVGAVLGGITLGAVMALLAAAASAAGLSSTEALGISAVLAVLAAACDSHVVGLGPPFFRRQVNEGWLVSLRGWVYGLGFGWQVGAGVTTYIMTTAVFLTIALGALSASPAAALALGTLFGLARGLAAFSPGRATTVEALFAFHRRFDALAPVVRGAVIFVELGVALVAAGTAWDPLAAAAVAALAGVFVARWLLQRPGRRADHRADQGVARRDDALVGS